MPFIGNTAPFHITYPPIDNYVQVVPPTATMVVVTCSLNVTIPSSTVVIWIHNNSQLPSNKSQQTDSTTTLLIGNFQQSDTGFYRCILDDASGSGWVLTRNISLIISKFICRPKYITLYYTCSHQITSYSYFILHG